MTLKRKHATPLLILAATLVSQGVAHADWDGCKPQQRQRVQKIDQPSLNGIYFSSTSDQSGVCRALGFERAAEGSIQTSGSAVGPVIVADSNGRIANGTLVNSSSGYWISSILCINPIERPFETPELVNGPNINGLYFSSTSDQTDVCRALGYERAADGSAMTSGAAAGIVLVASSEGKIAGGAIVNSSSGYWISNLICVNRISDGVIPENRTIEKITGPQLDGIYFSSKSDQDGVCRAMGYSRAAVGSATTSGSAVGDVIIVNEQGDITAGDVVNSSNGYWISEIVCVGHGHGHGQGQDHGDERDSQ